MLRVRRGGFILWTSVADHAPKHVHVFRDGALIVKWDLERNRAMQGRATRRIVRLIDELREEGKL